MSSNNSQGVDYIVNSKRPYPEWLRNHKIFKESSKIDKVFPKIGLPNFRETCDIMNTQEAKACAASFVNAINAELNTAQRNLRILLDKVLGSKEQDRNEKCAEIQSLVDLMSKVSYSIGYGDYIHINEGKVVLRLRQDIFHGEKAPVFRKDEGLIRVAGKLWESAAKLGVKLAQIDRLQSFKDFSRVNIPNKKYNVVFSSAGEEGAWDIGTISMRGVASCQSWHQPQSRGLIGSISSKFVGVIYIESEQEIPGYGSKMLNRSVVRFAINKNTRKPAILVDHMYPNENADTLKIFKKVLAEKSGLDVFYIYGEDKNKTNDYYIPNEPTRAFYQQGEQPYMDVQVEVREHAPAKKRLIANVSALNEEFKKNVCNDLKQMYKVKRELYEEAAKTIAPLRTAYDDAKTKWISENESKPIEERTKFEMPKPEMDEELHQFGKGGLINLFGHCDKKYGKDSAGEVFGKLILDSIDVPLKEQCVSKQDFHRKYIMSFLKNPNKAKAEAYKKYAAGSWMKSFPKSSEKFFDSVFAQMRGYMLASVRDMIKNQN